MEVISIERSTLRGNRLAASFVEELLTSFKRLHHKDEGDG